ncbi:hypothetical protein NC652_033746 [Populus alba x Populus x berolinensis]|nr:hypothetical protein NC652_033746 [Populus alba x Populus x berolinensis]
MQLLKSYNSTHANMDIIRECFLSVTAFLILVWGRLRYLTITQTSQNPENNLCILITWPQKCCNQRFKHYIHHIHHLLLLSSTLNPSYQNHKHNPLLPIIIENYLKP